jgi:hypothetical protein
MGVGGKEVSDYLFLQPASFAKLFAHLYFKKCLTNNHLVIDQFDDIV